MVRLTAVCLLLLCCPIIYAGGGNYAFSYQAKLTDSDGVPLSGPHNFYFSIFAWGSADVADSGNLIYSETVGLTADNGIVTHAIGSVPPTFGTFSQALFAVGNDFFIQVAIDAPSN